jgi:hypothetical protein
MKSEARQYAFYAEFWTFACVSTIYLNEEIYYNIPTAQG